MAGTILSQTIQNGVGASTSTSNIVRGTAKAWVQYNGFTQTVNASNNVSSVTYLSGGDYTINFTTAMPSANYAVIGSTNGVSGSGGPGIVAPQYATSLTASSATVETFWIILPSTPRENNFVLTSVAIFSN